MYVPSVISIRWRILLFCRALEFVRDELSNPVLQLGTRPRTVILLADGLWVYSFLIYQFSNVTHVLDGILFNRSQCFSEYDQGSGEARARHLVQDLEETFYISTLLITKSTYIKDTFSSVISSSFQLLSVDYWYQIQNGDIVQRALDWSCSGGNCAHPKKGQSRSKADEGTVQPWCSRSRGQVAYNCGFDEALDESDHH